jgi:hypothetical protein
MSPLNLSPAQKPWDLFLANSRALQSFLFLVLYIPHESLNSHLDLKHNVQSANENQEPVGAAHENKKFPMTVRRQTLILSRRAR